MLERKPRKTTSYRRKKLRRFPLGKYRDKGEAPATEEGEHRGRTELRLRAAQTKTKRALRPHKKNYINFIKLTAGKGNVFVHHAPLAFSNYFLLHKNNMSYYETAMSFVSNNKKRVVWDEYYTFKKNIHNYNRPDSDGDKKGFMSVLFQYPGLKWAFISALLLLLLFVLIEMRRKQRYIPVFKKPVNESLEFVKTIGRLYFDRGDHKNLCLKMRAYFLEHIRNRYKLATGNMNEQFIKTLQFKTGYPEDELRSIVGFISQIENTAITEQQLKVFHLKLEEFYKRT